MTPLNNQTGSTSFLYTEQRGCAKQSSGSAWPRHAEVILSRSADKCGCSGENQMFSRLCDFVKSARKGTERRSLHKLEVTDVATRALIKTRFGRVCECGPCKERTCATKHLQLLFWTWWMFCCSMWR
jgi:hypothetical protein